MAQSERFHALHREGFLVLPNAWDAGSARLIESAGAKAIATSSSAVSWAHGYPDGEALPVETLAQTVREIVRVVRVPVSVDVETGYASEPAGIVPAIRALVDAGAVGVNLEDRNGPPGVLAAKIEIAKRTARSAGIALFVNARADGFLHPTLAPDQRLDDALARARAYRDAGADGFFAPGLTDEQQIATLAKECGLPLNLLARPNLAPPDRLKALGVRRLSLGGAVASAALGCVRRLCGDVLERGAWGDLFLEPVGYAEMNALFTRG